MALAPSFVATPDQTAVDLLSRMPAVEKEVWAGLLPEVRALTFTIKLTQDTDSALRKAEAMRVMERAKALIASLPAGADAKKITKQIAADLGPFFPTPAQAARRAELLVRHWAGMIRNAAWYRTLDRQRTAYPYWKYVTFGDNRVRETHEALNGLIIPADSPFWDTHFPPWAPMCRCMVVPITQAEYDRIKAKEKSMPIENRTIVDGPRLEALEKSNTIVTGRKFRQADGTIRTGPPTPFPVAPEPGWTGWNPRDLRITHEALTDRYATRPGGPQALQKMMAKAEKVKLTPDITLADHIRGLPDGKRLPAMDVGSPAKSPKRNQREKAEGPPASAPTPPASIQPASALPEDQISAKLKLKLNDPRFEEPIGVALDAISSLHSVSGMKVSPVKKMTMDYEGLYVPDHGSPAARQFHPEDFKSTLYFKRGSTPNTTDVVHEIGHKIESEAIALYTADTDLIPPDHVFHPAAWQAHRELIALLKNTSHFEKIVTATGSDTYLQRHTEIFARAYSQYVTRRSGDARLAADAEAAADRHDGLWWWPEDEFSTIVPAFDSLFQKLGWIHTYPTT